jgi:hypothetical protein
MKKPQWNIPKTIKNNKPSNETEVIYHLKYLGLAFSKPALRLLTLCWSLIVLS